MSREPFDDIDRALASGLSGLAPEIGGADETLASVRPRFERARTRARIVKFGAGLAVLAVVGTVATIAAPDHERSHVSVNAPGSTPTTSTSRSTRPDKKHAPSTTAPKHAPGATTSTVTTPATPGSNSGHPSTSNPSGPTTPVTAPTTAPVTTPDGNGGSGPTSGGGHGRDPGGPSTTTTVPQADGTHVYHSDGGSITVRVSHGTLQLLSKSAASGYHALAHTASDDIDVRFVSSHGTWRIRVRFDDHGHLTHEVDHS